MTHDEFRAARIELGLSISEAGAAFGVSGDTVKRWEARPEASRGRDIPPSAAQLMRLLSDLGAVPEWMLI